MARFFCENLGQMLRPGLVLAASCLGGQPPGQEARDLAALVELVHGTSLLHDDVIDRSELRRGRPTVHSRWGEREAVLLGDLLLAHGLALVAPHAREAVLDTVAAITRDLAAGQLLELEAEGEAILSPEEYLRIIRLKTATFFGHCSRLGGLAGELEEEDLERLEVFGTSLGFAYQMLDDLLDLASDAADLGKPVGADLANQRLTLPVLHLLEIEGPDGPTRAALGRRDEAFLLHEVPQRIHSQGAFEKVVGDARGHCQEARESLAGLQARHRVEVLEELLDYLFGRLAGLTGKNPAPLPGV